MPHRCVIRRWNWNYYSFQNMYMYTNFKDQITTKVDRTIYRIGQFLLVSSLFWTCHFESVWDKYGLRTLILVHSPSNDFYISTSGFNRGLRLVRLVSVLVNWWPLSKVTSVYVVDKDLKFTNTLELAHFPKSANFHLDRFLVIFVPSPYYMSVRHFHSLKYLQFYESEH